MYMQDDEEEMAFKTNESELQQAKSKTSKKLNKKNGLAKMNEDSFTLSNVGDTEVTTTKTSMASTKKLKGQKLTATMQRATKDDEKPKKEDEDAETDTAAAEPIPEPLSDARTQNSRTTEIKAEDDTIQHVESLKESRDTEDE
ncbi:unnamed protein product [Toxocara canis]|nr:unnamed protein product [Toxocara canis]